jgi:AcrR family transcriptional regulator
VALAKPPAPRKRSAQTREQLIGATEDLLCRGGLAGVTTQSVARACGLSEGTIYRHFQSREELIVATLRERLPGEIQQHVNVLKGKPGDVSLELGLAGFVAAVMPIFMAVAPAIGMLAADPALAARNAEAARCDGKSPSMLVAQLAEFFREEQRQGRARGDFNCRAAAGVLMSTIFYRALMRHLFSEDPTGLTDAEFASAVAALLSRGVLPPDAAPAAAAKKKKKRAGS